MLENLLALSTEVCASDDQITPVQAWNLIRSQPHFGGFELQALQTLAETLRDIIACHGYVISLVCHTAWHHANMCNVVRFGAAIPQTVFRRLTFEFLLKGKPF